MFKFLLIMLNISTNLLVTLWDLGDPGVPSLQEAPEKDKEA